VREVRVKRLVYPDPSTRADRVRRAIEAFGIGEHIKVKLTSKKTRHGTIWQPQDDVFTFVPDNSAGRLPIAYDEVVELQPTVAPRPRQGRHPLVKFGIAYGVLMAFIWIGSGSNGGLP
jgi:hypothetical protein